MPTDWRRPLKMASAAGARRRPSENQEISLGSPERKRGILPPQLHDSMPRSILHQTIPEERPGWNGSLRRVVAVGVQEFARADGPMRSIQWAGTNRWQRRGNRPGLAKVFRLFPRISAYFRIFPLTGEFFQRLAAGETYPCLNTRTGRPASQQTETSQNKVKQSRTK